MQAIETQVEMDEIAGVDLNNEQSKNILVWTRKSCVMGKCEIPKILEFSFHLDPKNYTPSIISIGQYHYGSIDAYSTMEKFKASYLNYLLEINPKIDVKKCLRELLEIEHEIRACFTSEFSMGLKNFVTMILFDAVFIYCNLNGFEEPHKMETEKPVSRNQFDKVSVDRDLLLLENQLPFQAIEKINHLFIGGDAEIANSSVRKRIASELNKCLHRSLYVHAFTDSELPREFDHLLHLCHIMLKPVVLRDLTPFSRFHPHLKSAKEYYNAKVRLKEITLGEGGAHSILDISFSNGILEIPPLYLDVYTITMLRNLIVFEQLRKGYDTCDCYVSAYVEFICRLVRTPEDLALLSARGILVTSFGGNAELIEELNSLYKSFWKLSGRGCYLDPLYMSLEKFCNRKSIFTCLVSRGE